MMLCPKHYTQIHRYGHFLEQSIYDKNEIVAFEDRAEIVLKNKKCEEVARAIIDLEDVEKCSQYKWHTRRAKGDTLYVITSLKGEGNKKIHLHRFVLDYDGPLDVDHVNRNGLDNRKCNLKIVEHKRNSANNKHAGIYKVKSGRYRASCTRNYKSIYIGTYDTYEEAAAARAAFIQKIDSDWS